MCSRRLYVVLALAFLVIAPRLAHAQDEDPFQIYGSDDEQLITDDIGPTVPAMRHLKLLMNEFNTYNMVDVSETCIFDQQSGGGRASGHHGAGGSWDDPAEDDFRCSRMVEIIAAIAGLRGILIGDLIVAYCVAAEIVQETLPAVLQWLEDWRAQAERRGTDNWRIERLARDWGMTAWQTRFTIIEMEQVALRFVIWY